MPSQGTSQISVPFLHLPCTHHYLEKLATFAPRRAACQWILFQCWVSREKEQALTHSTVKPSWLKKSHPSTSACTCLEFHRLFCFRKDKFCLALAKFCMVGFGVFLVKNNSFLRGICLSFLGKNSLLSVITKQDSLLRARPTPSPRRGDTVVPWEGLAPAMGAAAALDHVWFQVSVSCPGHQTGSSQTALGPAALPSLLRK